ncbi:MAG: imelysin family protein [Pseudomonadota bacterium]
MWSHKGLTCVAVFVLAAGCSEAPKQEPDAPLINTALRQDVLKTNANIAYASYTDSYLAALDLRDAVNRLINEPTDEHLESAQQAWLAAREPYGQTEVYRFRGGPIDALRSDGTLGEDGEGPEGHINAWPLGEALIDYVADTVDGDSGPEIPGSTSNINGSIIADLSLAITEETIRGNFELGGDERNVTSGYHAIEFLLWGQDLNQDGSGSGPRDAGAGQRPVSDFATDMQCTSGVGNTQPVEICQRRGSYLAIATDLLIEDLKAVADAWSPNSPINHYANFVNGGDASLSRMLEGMGRLSFGELAGERMNIALLTNSQEDEHSCFSDNTHRDIFLNAKGIANSFLGEYRRIDGEVISGVGIDDLLRGEGLHAEALSLSQAIEDSMIKVSVIDAEAKAGNPFDKQIQGGIGEPNVSGAIRALAQQTKHIEAAIAGLGLSSGDLRQDTEQSLP